MKITSFICLVSCICLFACQDSPKESTATYDIGLVESKKITLPIDENSYYHSRYMFQFEEGEYELLVFQNTEKGTHKIIVFDIENQKVFKEIPINKEGPNGISSLSGCFPFFDSQTLLMFQDNINRITVYTDQGKVIKNYSTRNIDGSLTYSTVTSNLYLPCFIKDSVLYLENDDVRQNMKKGDWQRAHLFRAQDLKTGEHWKLPLFYPSSFNMEIKNPSAGYGIVTTSTTKRIY